MSYLASLYHYICGSNNRWDSFKLLTVKGLLGKLKHDDLYCRHMTKTKSIFIHIPKTAGQSVSISLFGEVRSGHQLWRNYYLADKNAYDSYFKFAFVRDPISRFESAYYYLKGGGYGEADKRFGDEIIGQYRDINHFATEWLSTKNAYSWIHMIPQYEFICDNSGRFKVDYVGKFETLQEDYEVIAKQLGIEGELSEMNRTAKKSRCILSDKAIENIKKVYRYDYVYLGYKL